MTRAEHRSHLASHAPPCEPALAAQTAAQALLRAWRGATRPCSFPPATTLCSLAVSARRRAGDGGVLPDAGQPAAHAQQRVPASRAERGQRCRALLPVGRAPRPRLRWPHAQPYALSGTLLRRHRRGEDSLLVICSAGRRCSEVPGPRPVVRLTYCFGLPLWHGMPKGAPPCCLCVQMRLAGEPLVTWRSCSSPALLSGMSGMSQALSMPLPTCVSAESG